MNKPANPKCKYMLTYMKRLTQATTAVILDTLTIDEAANQYHIDKIDIQNHIDMMSDKYEKTQNDVNAFETMAYYNIITHTLVNKLKPDYTTLTDFGNLAKMDFCQAMREKQISITTMIKLIDIMMDRNIYFMDTKSYNDMLDFKRMLDILR